MIRETPKAVPCARCKSPSDTEVWGFRICYDCHSVWIRDDRFSSGTINAALGQSDEIEALSPKSHSKYCTEATRRTREWLTEVAP